MISNHEIKSNLKMSRYIISNIFTEGCSRLINFYLFTGKITFESVNNRVSHSIKKLLKKKKLNLSDVQLLLKEDRDEGVIGDFYKLWDSKEEDMGVSVDYLKHSFKGNYLTILDIYYKFEKLDETDVEELFRETRDFWKFETEHYVNHLRYDNNILVIKNGEYFSVWDFSFKNNEAFLNEKLLPNIKASCVIS